VVQSFLRNADRDDPRQAGLVRRIAEGMKRPDLRVKANKPRQGQPAAGAAHPE
jgi:hypothetical protein